MFVFANTNHSGMGYRVGLEIGLGPGVSTAVRNFRLAWTFLEAEFKSRRTTQLIAGVRRRESRHPGSSLRGSCR